MSLYFAKGLLFENVAADGPVRGGGVGVLLLGLAGGEGGAQGEAAAHHAVLLRVRPHTLHQHCLAQVSRGD